MEHYTDRKGLHYYDDGSYRGVSDPSEQKKFFLSYQLVKYLISQRASHTHNPDDDAECMFLLQIILDQCDTTYKKNTDGKIDDIQIITDVLSKCTLST